MTAKVSSKKVVTKKAAGEIRLGKNVRLSLDKNDLVIKVDGTQDFGLTASSAMNGGNNHLIATTGRAQQVQLPNGKTAMLVLTMYSNQL